MIAILRTRWSNRQQHRMARFFDQANDMLMMQVRYIDAIDRQKPVTNV